MYHPTKRFHYIKNVFVLLTFDSTDLNIYFTNLNFYMSIYKGAIYVLCGQVIQPTGYL